MKQLISLFIPFLFSSSVFASRAFPFHFDYAARCPMDRVSMTISVTNVSQIDQTVSIKGSCIVLFGDGACYMPYSNYHIVTGTVYTVYYGGNTSQTTPMFSESGHTASAIAQGNNTWLLRPGGHVQFIAAGPGYFSDASGFHNAVGGASGTFNGRITISEDRGAVVSTGTINMVQDSASPNYTMNMPVQVNAGRPF